MDNLAGSETTAFKRFSEFLGGKRKRFSEFLGGKKRFSEFLGGKKKRFSEFLGGKKRSDVTPNLYISMDTAQLKEFIAYLLAEHFEPTQMNPEEQQQDYGGGLRVGKRFSEFLGGKRSAPVFGEARNAKRRYGYGHGNKRLFSEFLGGKR